jgi:aspartyl-tRNA synthetase
MVSQIVPIRVRVNKIISTSLRLVDKPTIATPTIAKQTPGGACLTRRKEV